MGGKNPRTTFKTPITVEDVLNSRMIAYPFRLLQCRLVTDGGGESVETPMVSQMEDLTSSCAFRVAGPKAFAEAGITHKRRRPSDDLRPPLFAARGRLRASADLRPRGSRLWCRAARPPPSLPNPTPPPAANSRSTPMAAAFPTCIHHVERGALTRQTPASHSSWGCEAQLLQLRDLSLNGARYARSRRRRQCRDWLEYFAIVSAQSVL
jgi:hypothetical protein